MAAILPLCDFIFVAVSLFMTVANIASIIYSLIKWYADNAALQFVALSFSICTWCFINGISLVWSVRLNKSLSSIAAHVLQIGYFYRTVELLAFVPKETLKLKMGELCVLRFLYSVMFSFSFITLQWFMLFSRYWHSLPQLLFAAACITTLDCCFGLACFSWRFDRENANNFVLSWLGILGQLLWRLGTVSARVIAIAAYSSLFTYFIFLVLALHWCTIMLCLLLYRFYFARPKQSNVRTVETVKDLFILSLLYIIYFARFPSKHNPDLNSRKRLLFASVFYAIMFAENSLLLLLWLQTVRSASYGTQYWFQTFAFVVVWGGFIFGLCFMVLYYQCCHIAVLTKCTTNRSSTNAGFLACRVPALLPRKLPSLFQPNDLSSASKVIGDNDDGPLNDVTQMTSYCMDSPDSTATTVAIDDALSSSRTLSAPLKRRSRQLDSVTAEVHLVPSNEQRYSSETALTLDAPRFEADCNMPSRRRSRTLPRSQDSSRSSQPHPPLSSMFVNGMFQARSSSSELSADGEVSRNIRLAANRSLRTSTPKAASVDIMGSRSRPRRKQPRDRGKVIETVF